MPFETDITVASTTDTEEIISAVANNDEKAARTEEPAFDSEKLDGSTSLSFEHPRSERAMLMERLAAAETDLDALTGSTSELVSSTESESDEAEPDEAEPENIDMDAVRAAATQDAIEAARARQAYYEEQTASHLAAQPAVDPLRAQVNLRFNEQLESLGADLTNLRNSQVVIPKCVEGVLLTHAGGAQATLWLPADFS